MANMIRRSEAGGLPIARGSMEPMRLIDEMMRWDPFREMLPSSLASLREMGFSPDFEVKETKDGYVFRADLPGVEEKDIDISLSGRLLTVGGKREAEKKEESETYFTYERSYGSFSRSFTLPEGADIDHVNADMKNGVLTITVGKMAEHQARKIPLGGLVDKVKGVFEKGKEKVTPKA